MKHLGYITGADSIFLWFPSQNRTFLGRKPYVFGSETVCFWFGNRMFLVRKPYGFGTENVKRRLVETDVDLLTTVSYFILSFYAKIHKRQNRIDHKRNDASSPLWYKV